MNMTDEQKKRFIELSRKLKPDIVKLDDLRKLRTKLKKDEEDLKNAIKQDQKELIDLMKIDSIKFTPDDIELCSHYGSSYLRISDEV